MSQPYIDALKNLGPSGSQSHQPALESMFGTKRTGGNPSAAAVAPQPDTGRRRGGTQDLEAQFTAKVGELDVERLRYLETIETLAAHIEERPHDPNEMVEMALIVAEAIVGKAFLMDHNLVIDRVTQALDSLEGERPTRLRMAPADHKMLADERPDLLARSMEIVLDPKIASGGCIVEGARRGIDATIEDRLKRFALALKQRLTEEASHE